MINLDPAIVVAIISGIVTLTGTIATVHSGNAKIQADLDKHNAVQDERIQNLTNEVRRHNNFAEKIPKMEAKIEAFEKKIDKLS